MPDDGPIFIGNNNNNNTNNVTIPILIIKLILIITIARIVVIIRIIEVREKIVKRNILNRDIVSRLNLPSSVSRTSRKSCRRLVESNVTRQVRARKIKAKEKCVS